MSSGQATPEMAVFCFHVVESALRNEPPPTAPTTIPNDPFPIFVSFKTGPRDDLRGCIGNFSPAPLRQQLADYAQQSAFHDTRFSPIRLDELPALKCTVSLLHSFEPAKAWDDWEIGTHGIRIKFVQGKATFRATFLPSVAAECGWNHKETMHRLLRKAGAFPSGRIPDDALPTIEVERYQDSHVSVPYRNSAA